MQTRTLYLAFELSLDEWLLAFATAPAEAPRLRTVAARDVAALAREIADARKRFKLPADAPVKSVYEAGRDGFWLHRHLAEAGVDNVVVDAGSIEGSRRSKQPKTDKIDVRKLLAKLQEYHGGNKRVWSVVRVPGPVDEQARHLHRCLDDLKEARTLHGNRIQGLLMLVGVCEGVDRKLPGRLDALRDPLGRPLPPELKARVLREHALWLLADEQAGQVEYERKKMLKDDATHNVEPMRRLLQLKGIGLAACWVFHREFFGWRKFRNRREVGACAGLVGTPCVSGAMDRDRGITKAGSKRMRKLAVEIAWCWLKWQPGSELAKWFHKRFGQGKRLRKVGIVALARKLLVSLWRYLETGEVPPGAELVKWESKLGVRAVPKALAA